MEFGRMIAHNRGYSNLEMVAEKGTNTAPTKMHCFALQVLCLNKVSNNHSEFFFSGKSFLSTRIVHFHWKRKKKIDAPDKRFDKALLILSPCLFFKPIDGAKVKWKPHRFGNKTKTFDEKFQL